MHDNHSDIRKTVLLIEEEDSLARAMDHVVRQDGHACARLQPKDRIVQRVLADHPALIMMDLDHSNRTEALEACQRIRRSPELSDVKILMLQASDSARDRRRGLALGANGMVTLPFRLADLRAEMRRLLGQDLGQGLGADRGTDRGEDAVH